VERICAGESGQGNRYDVNDSLRVDDALAQMMAAQKAD